MLAQTLILSVVASITIASPLLSERQLLGGAVGDLTDAVGDVLNSTVPAGSFADNNEILRVANVALVAANQLSAATNIRAAQSAAVFQIAVAQTDSFNTIKSATTLAAIDLLAAPFLAAIDTMDTAFGTQRQTAATAAMMQAYTACVAQAAELSNLWTASDANVPGSTVAQAIEAASSASITAIYVAASSAAGGNLDCRSATDLIGSALTPDQTSTIADAAQANVDPVTAGIETARLAVEAAVVALNNGPRR